MLLGKLDKMKLQAYADQNFSQPQGQPIDVLVNPESYTLRYRVEHTESQGQGTSHPQVSFNRIRANEIHLDFIFDSSGVLVEPSLLMGGLINPFAETANVIDKVDEFKHKLINYQSETHRPNFVVIHWGTLLFKGQLTSMEVEFKLFKPDGTPIRAMIRADFTGYIEDDLRVALENPFSPDITHERLFKADDRFALMVDNVYENPNHYIDVAKANGLTSFRNIPTGTKLFFPPVEK